MSAAELVRLVTNGLFVLVFIAVARSALRERTRANLDTSLLFGAIALVVAQSQISSAAGLRSPILSAMSLLLLLALPYLQLRLVDDFAGVPPMLMRVCVGAPAVVGLAVAVAWLAAVDLSTAAVPLIGVAILYFVGFGAYAALCFVREARRTGGIARRRMALAATGCLALSLTLLSRLWASSSGRSFRASRRCSSR